MYRIEKQTGNIQSGAHVTRRHSFSAGDDRSSFSEVEGLGKLRIVIDRPEADSSGSAGKPVTPLEIPIPHHKLGGLGLTAGGSLMVRSSSCTRASTLDNPRSSMSINPDGYLHPMLNDAMRIQSWIPSLFPTSRVQSESNSQAQSSVFYKLKEPIEPSVFDELLPVMDDASVVRYAKGTKKLSAATPARIVAQISSDSFMDYELVSDFFLSFRAYLSPSNLLSLLLARLEWAINRLEDDGRIIRIRAFAALRHWILNYFVDDFLKNYDLRAQFCNRINNLYEDVKNMNNSSPSDLKIILDLKRCWNGRYAVYWGAQELSIEAHPDDLIMPGEFFSNPFSGYSSIGVPRLSNSEFIPAIGSPLCRDEESKGQAPQAASEDRSPRHHTRQTSTTSAYDTPTPPTSPKSAQATSVPVRASKRGSLHSSRTRIPRPIPLTISESNSHITNPLSSHPISPLWRRPFHSHKRSGSFSDSVRDDRAPLPHSSLEPHTPFQFQATQTSSIIRGNVFLPVDPYVTSAIPPSPSLETPSTNSQHHDPLARPDYFPKSPSPAVKTFIGSIRRALHQKPGNQNPSNQPNRTPELRGKTSLLPPNIVYKADSRREKRGKLASRHNNRLDVLCHKSFHSYSQLINGAPARPGTNGHASSESENESSYANRLESDAKYSQYHRQIRAPSQMTTGSKSIVIVDDTGLGISLVPGRLGMSFPKKADSSIPMQRSSTNPRPTSSRPISNRLRKYASYQSGITKYETDSDSGTIDVYRNSLESRSNPPANRMLRRMPGGDLRQMQLENPAESDQGTPTFLSSITGTDSTSSILYIAGKPTEDRYSAHAQVYPNSGLSRRYSMTRSRSQPQLRTSFEAAVAGFSKIPDEEDGGIEYTLRKLEGRWRNPPEPSPHAIGARQLGGTYAARIEDHRERVHQAKPPRARNTNSVKSYSESLMESEDSYCSIPLLERGLCDDSMKTPIPRHGPAKTHTHSKSHTGHSMSSEASPSHPSIEIVEKTESMNRIAHGSALPRASIQAGSSSENRKEHDDAASELSSEISVDAIPGGEGHGTADGRGPRASYNMRFAEIGIPTHPLAAPRSTNANRQNMDNMPFYVGSTDGFYSEPQTLSLNVPSAYKQPLDTPQASSARRSNSEGNHAVIPILLSPSYDHQPFVLAHRSETLAQQFTIIEQAALSEVDWKDLVDMKWSHSSQSTLNWVDYLSEQERKGIDMVVARFNLMVKWVVSEIVLTRSTSERVKTIIKLIHIAAYARKLRNYATMLQIAIALSSVDCTRLTKTWSRVPEVDRQTLKDMESLIQPIRNFHNLRLEMEGSVQDGCIPFVGEWCSIVPRGSPVIIMFY